MTNSEQHLPNAFLESVPSMKPSGIFAFTMRLIWEAGNENSGGIGAVGSSARPRFEPTSGAGAGGDAAAVA